MNSHRTSTELGGGKGTAPFPRPHFQKQNAAVYTKVWTHLLLLIALGTVLRFYALAVRPMYDEAASWTFARLPWHSFLKTIWNYEGNMTLYYLILRLWVHLGDSEVIVRSLSVFFGIATIPIVYLLGARLFDRRAGLISATLITVHAFHIRYSQEARSYALATLLISLSTLLLASALNAHRARGLWAAYVVASVLACYCHMFAALVLVAQWLWILTNGFSIFRSRITILAAQAVLVAPVGLYAVFRNKGQLDWASALNSEGFLKCLRSLVGGMGTGSLGTGVLLFFYGGLCLLAILVGLRSHEECRRSGTALLLLWLLVPLGVISLVSTVKPILISRFLLMCLPAFLLLAGSAIDSMLKWNRIGKWVGAFAVVAVFSMNVYGTVIQYRAAKSTTNDCREMTRYILSKQQPGDAVIFFIAAPHMSFRYYATLAGGERVPKIVIPDFGDAPTGANPIPSHEEIEVASSAYSRVWLVLDRNAFNLRPAWKQAAPLVRRALEQNCRLEGEQEIGRFLVSLYVHKYEVDHSAQPVDSP